MRPLQQQLLSAFAPNHLPICSSLWARLPARSLSHLCCIWLATSCAALHVSNPDGTAAAGVGGNPAQPPRRAVSTVPSAAAPAPTTPRRPLARPRRSAGTPRQHLDRGHLGPPRPTARQRRRLLRRGRSRQSRAWWPQAFSKSWRASVGRRACDRDAPAGSTVGRGASKPGAQRSAGRLPVADQL